MIKTSPRPPFTDHSIAGHERCLLGSYIVGADIGAHRVIFQAIKNLKAPGMKRAA